MRVPPPQYAYAHREGGDAQFFRLWRVMAATAVVITMTRPAKAATAFPSSDTPVLGGPTRSSDLPDGLAGALEGFGSADLVDVGDGLADSVGVGFTV